MDSLMMDFFLSLFQALLSEHKTIHKTWKFQLFIHLININSGRVPMVREKSGKNEKNQGQGKVREFWVEPGKFEILEKVREF